MLPELRSAAAPADTDRGGMPDEWEKEKKLDHTKPNVAGRELSTGYDKIEVYINSLVRSIT